MNGFQKHASPYGTALQSNPQDSAAAVRADLRVNLRSDQPLRARPNQPIFPTSSQNLRPRSAQHWKCSLSALPETVQDQQPTTASDHSPELAARPLPIFEKLLRFHEVLANEDLRSAPHPQIVSKLRAGREDASQHPNQALQHRVCSCPDGNLLENLFGLVIPAGELCGQS